MIDSFLSNASEVYAYAYFGTVIVIALVEWVAPRRQPGKTLALRWFGNIAVYVLNAIVVRAALPLGAIAWAALCHERGWGLLNVFGSPAVPGILVTLVVFDGVNYTQHYLFHRIPLLWRLHRTHHSDAEYDFSTGVRFHPLEALLVHAVQFLTIYLLGAAPAAVFATQVVFLVISFVEHANVRIPSVVDRTLRLVFVTPDMHRVHHSQLARENQSNFSNLFSWWDRLFGTYVHAPSAGHDGIVFGLPEFSERKHATLPWMLAQPFLSDVDATAVTHADVVVSKS